MEKTDSGESDLCNFVKESTNHSDRGIENFLEAYTYVIVKMIVS